MAAAKGDTVVPACAFSTDKNVCVTERAMSRSGTIWSINRRTAYIRG